MLFYNIIPGSGVNKPSSSSTNISRELDVMPLAVVTRIMKSVLPKDVRIRDGAKKSVQQLVTEFILYVTAHASKKCVDESRQKITGEDLIGAMKDLKFDDYIEPLTLHLKKYRESGK